ncbi:MAG: hypothetical protein U0172_02295 [Nitrospiraceae bacterium]
MQVRLIDRWWSGDVSAGGADGTAAVASPMRRFAGFVVLVGMLTTGCDYWPPALQTQIEQLKADLQTITAERARLEQQVLTNARAREELQSQVDQLMRSNRERTATIAELEHQLKQARAPKAVAATQTKTVAKNPVAAARKPGTVTKTAKKPAAKAAPKRRAPEGGVYYKTIR